MSENHPLSPDELALLATLLALAFSKVLTVDQLNVYGNFLQAVGSIMSTIASQQEILQPQTQPETATKDQLDELKKQVQALFSELK